MQWTERERSVMGDLYRIMQRFAVIPMQEPESTDYWSLLAATLNEFVNKWGMDHLTVNAAVFVSDWLQDVYKDKREAEDQIEAAKLRYCAMTATDAPGAQRTAKQDANLRIQHENAYKNPCAAHGATNPPPEAQDGQNALKNKENTLQTRKEIANREHSIPDPRIRDGMLCFL